MINAGIDIVPVGTERPDRTGGQTRLGDASGTGMRSMCDVGQFNPLAQQQRTTVCMPQPPTRMNQQSDRTLMHWLAPGREPLKRQRGRAARIEIECAELLSQRADDVAGPSVGGVGEAICWLSRTSQMR